MDLYGVAREMTIKFAIALIGSISETVAVVGTEGIIGIIGVRVKTRNTKTPRQIVFTLTPNILRL